MKGLFSVVAILFFVGWIVGFFVVEAGGLSHILLVFAALAVIFGLISGTEDELFNHDGINTEGLHYFEFDFESMALTKAKYQTHFKNELNDSSKAMKERKQHTLIFRPNCAYLVAKDRRQASRFAHMMFTHMMPGTAMKRDFETLNQSVLQIAGILSALQSRLATIELQIRAFDLENQQQ